MIGCGVSGWRNCLIVAILPVSSLYSRAKLGKIVTRSVDEREENWKSSSSPAKRKDSRDRWSPQDVHHSFIDQTSKMPTSTWSLNTIGHPPITWVGCLIFSNLPPPQHLQLIIAPWENVFFLCACVYLIWKLQLMKLGIVSSGSDNGVTGYVMLSNISPIKSPRWDLLSFLISRDSFDQMTHL